MKQQTLEKYIRSTSIKSKQQQKQQDNNGPHRTNTLDSNLTIKVQQRMPNVQFYRNKQQSRPYGQFIDDMHKKWWKDYDQLEKNHSFIQWIFPNTFQSRFNYHARPLSQKQIKIFKEDHQIIERYLKSYSMMLEFYGMKLKNKQTGQLVKTRTPDFRQRFHATLISSWHNHMRITRILSSLSLLGFSRYAKQLALFLKKQIQSGDLQKLLKYNVNKDWKQFQQCPQNQEEVSQYFKRKELKKIKKQ